MKIGVRHGGKWTREDIIIWAMCLAYLNENKEKRQNITTKKKEEKKQ